MKYRAILAGALLIAATTPAFAAGPYVAAGGGVSFFHDSDFSGLGSEVDLGYDTGTGFAVAAGYSFDGFRLEGEFGYRRADVDKMPIEFVTINGGAGVPEAEMTVTSYMLNGYYDITTGSSVTPFIGAGVGVINGEFEVDSEKDDDTAFGYQLAAGVSYAANKKLGLDLSYRLQGAATDFEFDLGELSYLSSNIFAGIRYNF